MSPINETEFPVTWRKAFLAELCQRPPTGLTEVRRDGKDNRTVATVIT